jgi:hypothetical protein
VAVAKLRKLVEHDRVHIVAGVLFGHLGYALAPKDGGISDPIAHHRRRLGVAHPVVTMMNSPVDMATLNAEEVRPEMEAVLTVDTTRGNRIVNHRGIAISPTVMQGWILRVAEDLLTIQQQVTGRMPVVLPITMQDITPYGNGLFHVNSVLQPCVATDAPVVGVALTAEVAVPGSATGASQPTDIEQAVRFCLEVAKAFGQGTCRFYDGEEWGKIQARYGSMKRLQTLGKG